MMAQRHGLEIENPDAIKRVNMAILNRGPIDLFDPYGIFGRPPEGSGGINWQIRPDHPDPKGDRVGVIIDDRTTAVPETALVLRPQTLAAGIGCNRGTDVTEIQDLLDKTLKENRLAPTSLKTIASVDIKQDEAGLLQLAERLDRPATFYTKEQLGGVKTIQSPSAMVEKHIGVKSVCEAAAILATGRGRLIVPKTTTRNVTVAIARAVCSS
jgi:cobalt-precorrin 5A hydrolase